MTFLLGLCKDKQINYLEEELKKMRKLLKRIDNFLSGFRSVGKYTGLGFQLSSDA